MFYMSLREETPYMMRNEPIVPTPEMARDVLYGLIGAIVDTEVGATFSGREMTREESRLCGKAKREAARLARVIDRREEQDRMDMDRKQSRQLL